MAEGVGFEPTRPFRVWRFSRPLVSTAHPPLRSCRCVLPASPSFHFFARRNLASRYPRRARSELLFRILSCSDARQHFRREIAMQSLHAALIIPLAAAGSAFAIVPIFNYRTFFGALCNVVFTCASNQWRCWLPRPAIHEARAAGWFCSLRGSAHPKHQRPARICRREKDWRSAHRLAIGLPFRRAPVRLGTHAESQSIPVGLPPGREKESAYDRP
jgi:hypothetical protein